MKQHLHKHKIIREQQEKILILLLDNASKEGWETVSVCHTDVYVAFLRKQVDG